MKRKVCIRCKEEKPLNEFYKCKGRKDGLQHSCKKCQGILSREYYQKNKVKVRQQDKIWRDSNPIKVWCGNTISRHKINGNKILFTREELYLKAKSITHCPWCNTKFEYRKGKAINNSPNLDRINNENFLTLDNIQIICRRCNTTKLDRTMKEFIDYCGMIYENFKEMGIHH